MPSRTLNRFSAPLGLLLAAGLLAGCNTLQRIADVGDEPKLTGIQNPIHQRGYKPVSLPMPAPVTARREPNSLWRPGSRAFFKDLRASRVGDLVTVMIDIDDSGELANTSERRRDALEGADAPALLGYEASLSKILPDAVNPDNLLELSSEALSRGDASIDREERIELKLAAVVTQILPNGNMVILGQQETRVNFEVRELQIMGVIRPEDIDNQNTIDYEQIAEARLSYGGRGHMTDVQQPRYGQQLIDILFPF
ncbi:MAG: flagellar basal body L-ring protein FlgH [Pseudomonadota bacterium]